MTGQASLFSAALPPGPWRIDQGDAVEWLRALPPESVDLVVTDPAYESLEKHRAKGTTTRLKVSEGSSNEWFSIFPNARFPDLMRELYRVLKTDRHCYVLCDQETMFVLKPIGEAVGFKFWKPLIWDKQRIGMGYHYRARYEVILFFEKGARRLNDLGVPDVLGAARVIGWQCKCADQKSTPRDTSKSSPMERGALSTESSGKLPMGRYAQGSNCTTSTETSATIASRTSKPSTEPPTSGFTPGASSAPGSGGNAAWPASPSSPLPQSIGTSLPRAGSSLGDVDPVTSGPPSDENSGSAPLCERCGQRKRKAFPTEKPVDLLATLIKQSTEKGEAVVDPFTGSGSTGDAATSLGRRFFGCDLSACAVDKARLRLAGRR